jgi:hypothetical protein
MSGPQNKYPKGWLGKRIKEAQEEMKTWPQWMRDTAKFEGVGEPR